MIETTMLKALPMAKVAPLAVAAVYLGAMSAEAADKALNLEPGLDKVIAALITALGCALIRWLEIKVLKTRAKQEVQNLENKISDLQENQIARKIHGMKTEPENYPDGH